MTDHDTGWIDNSSGSVRQYDFLPPRDWTNERIAAQQAAMAASLAALPGAADTGADEPGWLRLARRLPEGLRAALVAELRAGNRLTGIGSSGWPDEGSIVANLRDRFTAARQALPGGVAWRVLDDPHYAREELGQRCGAARCLIIT